MLRNWLKAKKKFKKRRRCRGGAPGGVRDGKWAKERRERGRYQESRYLTDLFACAIKAS